MKSFIKSIKNRLAYFSVAFILVGALLLLLIRDRTLIPSIVCFSLGAVLLILNSLGMFFYNKGGKILSGKKQGGIDKALKCLSLAITLGIDKKMEETIGSLIIQEGDKERGKNILLPLTCDKNEELRARSKTSLSMYYWMCGDLDSAIKLCEEVREGRYKDSNMYINLATYYLEKGNTKAFSKVIKEAKDNNMYVSAMLDLESVVQMKGGDYKKAGELLSSLFNRTDPKFPDPYIHLAIVYLHYGEKEKAVKEMEALFEKCRFNNISLYKREECEELLSIFKDDKKCWGLLSVAEKDPLVFYSRKIPEVSSLNKPTTPPLPSFEEPLEINIKGESDEEEVNTTLDDDDDRWLLEHGEEVPEEDEDNESPNTSLDDSDDEWVKRH